MTAIVSDTTTTPHTRKNNKEAVLQPVPVPTSRLERKIMRDNLFADIFGPEHKPKRDFPPAIRNRKSRGKFPTAKYVAGGQIRVREPLMDDGLVLLDTDPDVVALSPYPMVVRFEGVNSDGLVCWQEHVPDIGAMRKSGRIEFIDFVSDLDAASSWLWVRSRLLAAALQRDYDIVYKVHRAAWVRKQPRFRNRNLMWAHAPSPHQPAIIRNLARQILEQSLPMTIGQLRTSLDRNVMVSRWEGEPETAAQPVPGSDIVFTACMQLAFEGKVRVHMGDRPISSMIVDRRV